MLSNINQPIVAGLLGVSFAGIVGATALPFNDRIEYRIGNRIESQPAWLVPPKAEFRSLERGYGGIKILLALLATGGMVAVMLIARKEGELEPVRQRIKKYQEKAHEFNYAAEAAYQMAGTQMRYKKLAEADERAFEDELETTYCQSLGISPHEQQALLTGTTTLDSVAHPGDKVEAGTSAAIKPEPDRTTDPKMPNLSKYPSLLIYGVPGAGKSTFTEQEVAKRLKEGHRVIVLDPHAACGQWEGCEVVGAGMDYEAIDAKLVWFQKQVKDRYKTISSQSNPTFQQLTIVGEEFTNWSKRCNNSGEHFQTVNSDIRKAECYSIIVSHTRNLAGLGDAKGMGALRDESMLEVEILGEYNAETERATPRFEAMVKMPGQSLTNRNLVKLAKLDTPHNDAISTLPTTHSTVTDAAPGNSGKLAESGAENLGNPYGTRAERLEALLADVLAETLPPVFSEEFPLSEHSDRLQLAKLVIARNLGKEKTIWLLWGVRPGGRNHALYSEARAMLDRLINGEE
ncbi:hypothetical protein [Microcoleus sp. POL10_C6]|uniref:hypothetical protein n=1 Tax=Microcoleus sp. POL10_C6 TaxID=2818852 RepID=UPI002FD6B6D4